MVGHPDVIKHLNYLYIYIYIHMSKGLNLLHPRTDVAEMVIVFCVSLIVPEDLMFAIKSGKHFCIQSHGFLCHPYRSWEFHDSIKYQCPGVTVPKCRRFWRAIISHLKFQRPRMYVWCKHKIHFFSVPRDPMTFWERKCNLNTSRFRGDCTPQSSSDKPIGSLGYNKYS